MLVSYTYRTSTGDDRTRHSCGRSLGSTPSDQSTLVNNPSLKKLLIINSRATFIKVLTRGVPCGNLSQRALDSHFVIVLCLQHPWCQLVPHTHWSQNRKYWAALLLLLQVGLPQISRTLMSCHWVCHCPYLLQMNTLGCRKYPILVAASSIYHAQDCHCISQTTLPCHYCPSSHLTHRLVNVSTPANVAHNLSIDTIPIDSPYPSRYSYKKPVCPQGSIATVQSRVLTNEQSALLSSFRTTPPHSNLSINHQSDPIFVNTAISLLHQLLIVHMFV